MKYPHWFNPDTRQDMKDSLKEQWFNNVLELGDTDKLEEVITENADLLAEEFLIYVKNVKQGDCLTEFYQQKFGELMQDMIYRKLDDKAEQEIEWEVNE